MKTLGTIVMVATLIYILALRIFAVLAMIFGSIWILSTISAYLFKADPLKDRASAA